MIDFLQINTEISTMSSEVPTPQDGLKDSSHSSGSSMSGPSEIRDQAVRLDALLASGKKLSLDTEKRGADDNDGLETELKNLSKSEQQLRKELAGILPPSETVRSDDSLGLSTSTASKGTEGSSVLPLDRIDVLSASSDDSVFDFQDNGSSAKSTSSSVPTARSRFSPELVVPAQLPSRAYDAPHDLARPIDVLACVSGSDDGDVDEDVQEPTNIPLTVDGDNNMDMTYNDIPEEDIDLAPVEQVLSQDNTLVINNKSPADNEADDLTITTGSTTARLRASSGGSTGLASPERDEVTSTPVMSNRKEIEGDVSKGILSEIGWVPIKTDENESGKQRDYDEVQRAMEKGDSYAVASGGAVAYKLAAGQTKSSDNNTAFVSPSKYGITSSQVKSQEVNNVEKEDADRSLEGFNTTYVTEVPSDEESTSHRGSGMGCFCCRISKPLLLILLAIVAIAVFLPTGIVVSERNRSSTSQLSYQTDFPSLRATSSPVVSPEITSEPTLSPAGTEITSEPTLSPVRTLSPIFQSQLYDLLSSSCAGPAKLESTFSTQYKAFMWLMNNTHIETYSDEQKLQRYSMASFYYSTNGDNWTDNSLWLTDEDECKWYSGSRSPCTRGGKLESLELARNNLGGTFPDEICILSTLKRLVLEGGPEAKMGGWVPPTIGHLVRLQEIRVGSNALTGRLPDSLGSLRDLRTIDFSSNSLTNGLPSTLGDLTGLEVLDLSSNAITGIPTDIAKIRNLIELDLSKNKLSGSLPIQLVSLRSLRSLSLASNSFSGSIPDDYGNFRGLFHVFDLSDNNLTSTIPKAFGGLGDKIRQIFLHENRLTGTVPTELSSLTRLALLRIDANNLTGTIPEEVCGFFDENFGTMYADCLEVECECCNYCCVDGQECLVSTR